MDYGAMTKLGFGMYIVTSKHEDKTSALLANALVQVASDPNILALSISKRNFSHELIQKGKKFNVSVLTTDAKLDFIGKFGYQSGRTADKISGVSHLTGDNDVPIIIENCTAYFECEVVVAQDFRDNTVFFGEIKKAYLLNSGNPMSLDYYQKLVQGKIPPVAPGFTARYYK